MTTTRTRKGKCSECAALWSALVTARLAQDGPFGGYGMVRDLDAQLVTVTARRALIAHRKECGR